MANVNLMIFLGLLKFFSKQKKTRQWRVYFFLYLDDRTEDRHQDCRTEYSSDTDTDCNDDTHQ